MSSISTLDSGSTTSPDRHSNGIVDRIYGFLRRIPTGILWLLVIVWSIPTLGLFINSFRDRDAQRATGWWKVVPSELTIDNDEAIFGARSGRFLRMAPRENPDVNRWWMCDAGRLGYGHANAPTRLKGPRVRTSARPGEFADVGWDEAIDAAVEALRTAARGGVLADASATLEELWMLKAVTGAIDRWRALSFTHQREHVEAIEGAKKPETRARRIAATVEMVCRPARSGERSA